MSYFSYFSRIIINLFKQTVLTIVLISNEVYCSLFSNQFEVEKLIRTFVNNVAQKFLFNFSLNLECLSTYSEIANIMIK